MDALELRKEDELQITELVKQLDGGGHDFIQLKYFVAGSGHTAYGKFRQCLMEMDTRLNAIRRSKNEIIRRNAQISIIQQNRTTDGIECILQKCEIEDHQMIVDTEQSNLKRSIRETLAFYRMAIEFEKEIKDIPIEQLITEYWTARLEDLLKENTIFGGGNISGVLDTIDKLPEEQKKSLVELSHELRVIANENIAHYQLEASKRIEQRQLEASKQDGNK